MFREPVLHSAPVAPTAVLPILCTFVHSSLCSQICVFPFLSSVYHIYHMNAYQLRSVTD
jgi:hypothetical protein